MAAPPSGWVVGGAVGVPGAEGGPFFPLTMVGVSATRLHPGRPSVDLTFMTAPYPLAFGIANLVGRAALALPLRLQPGVYLLPSAGITALGAGSVSEDGAGALFGVNAGVSALVFGSGSTALRAGVTWHRFRESGDAVWLMELGWGTMHARAAAR